MKITFVLTVLVTGFAATSTNAGLVLGNPVVVTSSPLPGFITNHVTANTTTKLLATVLYLPLTSGTVSNIVSNVPTPTNTHLDAIASFAPGDSYWTINNDPDSRFSGGGGDAGGVSATPVFTDGGTSIDIAVFQEAPFDDHSGPGLVLGDLTFSNDANGVGRLLISTNPSTAGFDVFVTNGVLSITAVPEPASLTLMALGGLTVLRRRR